MNGTVTSYNGTTLVVNVALSYLAAELGDRSALLRLPERLGDPLVGVSGLLRQEAPALRGPRLAPFLKLSSSSGAGARCVPTRIATKQVAPGAVRYD